MKKKGLMKKLKGIMSLVTLLIMTVSSLGVPAQVFAADEENVPANLTVKHNDEQKWTVIQFDKVEDAQSYNIYRAEEQDGKFERIQTLKSDKTYTVDPYDELETKGTLKADYLYYYKVAAVVDGKEQDAAGPIANQDAAAKAGDAKIDAAAAAPSAATSEEPAKESTEQSTKETSEESSSNAPAAQTYGWFNHKTGCDGKHNGNTCNSNAGKHDEHCDKNHSKYRKCNSNNWKHGEHCDKNHSGKNCNENKWHHGSNCDENHSGHGCNNNWKHHEDCDKNHSGKHCNQNNYKEKWDAVKNVCVTEAQHHWLKLSWESKGSDAEYKIFRASKKCNDYHSGDFKEIAKVTGKTTYNDIKLDHNTTYCYKVMVKRPKVCPYTIETVSSSNIGKFTVCGTTLNPNIKAAAVSDKAIKVNWTNTKSDNASTRFATSYTLYRSTTNNINNATAITVNGKQDGSEMSYTDEGLNQCTTYYYWVKASYGQWSSWISPQWGSSCATTLKRKEIGNGLNGCIKNVLKCGCIPTRYYGAQIFLGTQNPNSLDYTKVRVYRRTSTGQYSSAYKTIDVRYAKYTNGVFGKGYYIDYSLSKVCLSKGTYYFALQAIGSDSGKEITGPMKEIGCVTVKW
ncbi:fibronectin type III domain-containing protein [Candidatus Enterococcus murrayae]|uniref:Fibronectin type III domain-containing protein n=1 Tax=Candidatus Enterococcus murrayae TaxID=2815321 RepID=A0ABS3HGX0_9ENTE|nr:fibronectin type III domain-containing protein [Enterococcus sp. MJM16]MBO0452694.1 fibronectin type III domain-containing protein [Enterococcus sp. MJM16]